MAVTEEHLRDKGEISIKGPGLKIRLDVRRRWKCEACGFTVKLPGERVAAACPDCSELSWLQLEEKQRDVHAYTVPHPTDIDADDLTDEEPVVEESRQPVEEVAEQPQPVEPEAAGAAEIDNEATLPADSASPPEPEVIEEVAAVESDQSADGPPRTRKKRNRRRRRRGQADDQLETTSDSVQSPVERPGDSSTSQSTSQTPPDQPEQRSDTDGNSPSDPSNRPADEGFGAGIF